MINTLCSEFYINFVKLLSFVFTPVTLAIFFSANVVHAGTCSTDRFQFLASLYSLYDTKELYITEYKNEIQDLMDRKKILTLRKSEMPISIDLESQFAKAENFHNFNQSQSATSQLKAEYDLSFWNERLRKKIIEADIAILNTNIALKQQEEKYNIFKLLLDIVYTSELINIYKQRGLTILRNIENFSLRRELGENTIKDELQAREEFLKTKNKRTSSEVRLLGFIDDLEITLNDLDDKLPKEVFLDLKNFKGIKCEYGSIEMRKLKAEKKKAELSLDLQKNSRLPVLSAFSSIEYDWDKESDPSSGRIGLNLNIPIFRGKETSRKIINARSQIDGIERKISRISDDIKRELVRRAAIEEIFILNLKSFDNEIENRENSLSELRDRESLGQTVFADLYATQSELSLLREAKAGILKEFFETYLLTLQKLGNL